MAGLLLRILLFSFLASSPFVSGNESHPSPLDNANPLVTPEVWLKLEPYFLPADHPIKMDLDHLFQKHRVTSSLESFEKCGFGKAKLRKPTNIVIGKSPRFKGFIFKVFLDCQPPLCEWENWLRRIEGASAIQQCLVQNDFHHFVVPKKWIYPLPQEPSPATPQEQRKNFILIVEDMNILNKKDNLKAYKTRMNERLLNELYVILSEVGLLDSVYPDNIPFTKTGQIAFVDTEHHHHPKDKVPYEKLTPFLSTKMGAFWSSLPSKH